jgi:hypothetical protein
MLKKTRVIGLAVVLGVVLLATRFSREPVSAQEKPVPRLEKWEYKIVLPDNGPDNDPRANQVEFNKLGTEGWELCVAHIGNRPEYCIFKRPKR